ncbi:DUF4255 domain-containing protein [Cochleicola gelatinilyticus]|uniref:Pvc16 N-terminal domain-containing protein n=1 Tax=Cochleicola gelatinilyticus TaxID=1763537 RepID=A0A167HPA5_9FLAO|nr:DUF4255 domain-containing protein [Cochleicola gelatinilyticus]OAB78820.1 hypothetical protein ULVI_09575 [Cochleicola gelatinilyticus]
MIYETLEILKDQVSEYLELKQSEANLVVLENVAKIDDPEITTMNDKIVLSLVNIEEEISLKNNPNIRIKNGETVYKNKPIHLNVYILFSANRTVYTRSITSVSYILEFFQGKNVFTQTNTPLNPTITTLDHITEFKFNVSLFTPTFEQLNYIWGTLGGKSLPSILYKVSIVKVESDTITDKGTPITQIEATLKNKTL